MGVSSGPVPAVRPQAVGKMLAEELARWTGVVNAANIKVE